MSRFFRRVHLRVAALALFALAVVPARASGQNGKNDQIDSPEVTRLTLRGVKAVEKSDLLKSISTDRSHCRSLLLKPFCAVSKSRYFFERKFLDRKELKRDVLRIRVFYWKRGYREAHVDTVVTEKGRKAVAITLRIHEGEPTRIATLTVVPAEGPFTERERRRMVTLAPGAPLNLLSLDSSRVRLRNELWNRGHGDADVVTDVLVSDSGRSADVSVVLDPRWKTTVGSIKITGDSDVSERTIRNSLTLKLGALYRRGEVVRSQRLLYESGLFKRAAIDTSARPDSVAADSVKTVEVTVQEAPLRDVRTSAGFNTVDFVQTEARFTHYNFLGGARRLDIQGTIGNLFARQLNGTFIFKDALINVGSDADRFLAPTWQASADVRQRWFRSPLNTIGLSVFAHRRSAPGVFIDRGYGTSATFTRELSQRALASANYRFEITRVEAGDVYFCVNYGVCDRPTIGALRAQQRLSPVSLSATVDRTNDPFSPSRGYIARTELEHASAFTVSDFRYNRAFVDGAAYRRFGRRLILAGHVQAGWVNALASTEQSLGAAALHPRKRFYAGGSRSVRGYGENQLGPRVLTIAADKLRGEGGIRCPLTTPIAACDPNIGGLEDRDFLARPLGGNTLIEGSVEARVVVWRDIVGAVFLDGAVVGTGNVRDFASGAGALTPGIGIRYHSPVGPIRIDVGYQPASTERLAVITEDDGEGSARKLIELTNPDGSPRERAFSNGRGVFNRLTLHLSIGEAF